MSPRFLSVLAAVATVVFAASTPASADSKPVAPAPAPAVAAQPAAITIASAAADAVQHITQNRTAGEYLARMDDRPRACVFATDAAATASC